MIKGKQFWEMDKRGREIRPFPRNHPYHMNLELFGSTSLQVYNEYSFNRLTHIFAM